MWDNAAIAISLVFSGVAAFSSAGMTAVGLLNYRRTGEHGEVLKAVNETTINTNEKVAAVVEQTNGMSERLEAFALAKGHAEGVAETKAERASV